MYYSVFNICTEQTTWYIISHKGNASYDYNVILMDIIKKDNTKCWQGYREATVPIHYWQKCKITVTFIRQFVIASKCKFTMWLSRSTLEFLLMRKESALPCSVFSNPWVDAHNTQIISSLTLPWAYVTVIYMDSFRRARGYWHFCVLGFCFGSIISVRKLIIKKI